jgi:hypothetical protein
VKNRDTLPARPLRILLISVAVDDEHQSETLGSRGLGPRVESRSDCQCGLPRVLQIAVGKSQFYCLVGIGRAVKKFEKVRNVQGAGVDLTQVASLFEVWARLKAAAHL